MSGAVLDAVGELMVRDLTPAEAFCSILESIDQRCMAADGPVPNTLSLATPNELRGLYRAAQKIKHEHEIAEMFFDRMTRFGNWDDNCFYYNGFAASELMEPLLLAATLHENSRWNRQTKKRSRS